MEAIESVIDDERLRRRRDHVEITLRHLESERRQVLAHTKLMDPRARESRLRLLDHLTSWYRKEIDDLENVIARGRSRARCSVCLEPIEAEPVENNPAADVCWECFEYAETLCA